jgi:hypothetical protein
VPGLTVFAVVCLAAVRKSVPLAMFTRDVTEIADLPYYAGFLSNLGFAGWAGTGAVCLFAGLLMRGRAEANRTSFYLAAGGLSLWLLLDDLGTMHEIVIPQYLGVSEKAVYAAYVGLLLLFISSFRRIIYRTNFGPLLAACGLAAMSVLVDAVPQGRLPAQHTLEDGAKFLAICAWAGYFVTAAFDDVKRLTASPAAEHRGIAG